MCNTSFEMVLLFYFYVLCSVTIKTKLQLNFKFCKIKKINRV